LCLGNNRLTSLEGSFQKFKFIQTLFLNNNKLRNLDKNLTILSEFSFLKNLNLFGNPLAEEPEYRNRVIYQLPSLEIFDRHSNL
jgi:Leucine-rich repeat (LRR) protein